MGSKSSFISVSLIPERLGRQAVRCEATESCNFQAKRRTVRLLTRGTLRFPGCAAWNGWSLRVFRRVDALFGVKPRNLAVFMAIWRDVRCGKAEICGFYGDTTRCAMWKSRNLRFLRGYDAICDVEPLNLAVFMAIRRDVQCGKAETCGF